jgi:hypothetical protein
MVHGVNDRNNIEFIRIDVHSTNSSMERYPFTLPSSWSQLTNLPFVADWTHGTPSVCGCVYLII